VHKVIEVRLLEGFLITNFQSKSMLISHLLSVNDIMFSFETLRRAIFDVLCYYLRQCIRINLSKSDLLPIMKCN